MFENVLPQNQLRLLNTLEKATWLKSFYLAGGTALALRIGHRQSVDFDFFSKEDFVHSAILSRLSEIGKVKLLVEEPGTLHPLLNDVRLSFPMYNYPMLAEPENLNNLSVASIPDIGAIKLLAISNRGAKKDFIDLYFILKEYTFGELLGFYHEKYGPEMSNDYHLLKSVLYFADAENDPMPRMLADIEWEDVKISLTKTVKDYMQL